MTLYGIDVSSNQPEGICSMVPLDFAIVKVTGNPQYGSDGQPFSWDFVNPYAQRQLDDACAKTGLVGCYAFTYGLPDPCMEAEHFVENVRRLGYLGKAMLVVDFEAQALDMGPAWVKRFAQRIEELAGYKPVIYCGGSYSTANGLFDLGFPMWIANYSKVYAPIYGYDTSGCVLYHGCEDAVMWQYTSTGYLEGYYDRLDCNVFFGSADDFRTLMGPAKDEPVNDSGLYYQAHVENIGWQEWKRDGQTAGTTGRALRLEALRVNPPEGVVIDVLAHIEDIGWKSYKGLAHGNNVVIGTTGQRKRIEYIEVAVAKNTTGKKLRFRVHQQDAGWKAWTEAGFASGSDGQRLRLEAIQMVLE